MQPKTTFANGKNPFRAIRRAAPVMRRHEVCAFVRATARPVTVAEIVQHFDLPLTNISRLLGELLKEGAVARTKRVRTAEHPDLRTKNVYSYVRPPADGKNDRIGPILAHLSAHPLSTLAEICAAVKQPMPLIASVMHFAVHKSGTAMCKKVDNRLVYWAAP
jgi:chromosome segregation and condensation protein ScpB